MTHELSPRDGSPIANIEGLLASLGLIAALVFMPMTSSARAQTVGDLPVRFLRSDGGTYVLTGPDGIVAACGVFARSGFIEVGWWRGPGTYTFFADYVGQHVETSITLDGSEYELAIGGSPVSNVFPVVLRQTPEVRVRWIDDTHLELQNDTDRALNVGTHGGSVFWDHSPAEPGLPLAEHIRRSTHPSMGCGTGWGFVVVPAHGTANVPIGVDVAIPGDYHGAIRFSDGSTSHVARFEVTVAGDSRADLHLTHH